MARKRSKQTTTTALPQGGMVMGNVGGAGVLDPATLPLPDSSLKSWWSDPKRVAAFSQPVAPRTR
jgi:hypothetical protein